MCKLSVFGWVGVWVNLFLFVPVLCGIERSQQTKHVVNGAHHIHIFHVCVCVLPNDARIMKCQFNYSRRCGDDTLSIRFNSFACHPIQGIGFYIHFSLTRPPYFRFYTHFHLVSTTEIFSSEDTSGLGEKRAKKTNVQVIHHLQCLIAYEKWSICWLYGLAWTYAHVEKHITKSNTFEIFSTRFFFSISVSVWASTSAIITRSCHRNYYRQVESIIFRRYKIFLSY